MNKDIEISIDEVYSQFHKHFSIEGNTKILFSGKYGIGKSYFLSKYFKNISNEKIYNTVIISPVNYVVSSNEDIFDLIKVYIIKSLYKNYNFNISEISKKVSGLKVLKEYAKKKPLELVSNLSSCLTKISPMAEALSSISGSVVDLISDFEKFENSLQKESATKEKKLVDFETTFVAQKNSYLEYNFISQAIVESLKEIKLKSKKDNVLIIEDFDRLDPAHIFRILNIFSAHNFEDENGNKFGFDKIIIVCDLSNIKTIYHHFYGVDTDFVGYMDKFYSFEPFEFDNKQAIAFHLKDTLKLQLPNYAMICLVEILSLLINDNKLTLRRILKALLVPRSSPKEVFSLNIEDIMRSRFNSIPHVESNCKSIYINTEDLPLLNIIRILKVYFESYESAAIALDGLARKNIQFKPDVKESIVKTSVLSATLMNTTSTSDPYRILFENTSNYDYPHLTFLAVPVRANLNWMAGRKYTGDKSFYEDVNYSMRTRADRVEVGAADINTQNYFGFLIEFIKFSRGKGWILD